MRLPNRMLALFAALVLLAPLRPVLAAEEQDADDEGFPSSSVARLIVNKGSAWVLSSDTGDWEEFETNAAIPPRTRINIPEGSESELQFHNGQYMLLTGGSEIDVRNLTDDRSSFRLRAGEIRFDLPAEEFAPVRVALPGGGVVRFPVPGKYWLTVVGGGDVRLVVRRGEGAVSIARGDYTVREGQEATIGDDVLIRAFAGGPDREPGPPPLTDAERQAGVPPAAAYELREYGEWITVPTYGVVWRPRVVAGWSPYYYGTWTWVSPFGWTWVSYEPWGWWPYHYGWWRFDPAFGWYWCPLRSFVSVNVFVGRPFFFHRARFFPSTVRFVHEGRQIRWVPLRPGERFVRPSFTRVDSRLATWNRPLARGAVFARHEGRGGAEWREWREVSRSRSVVVRSEGQARIQQHPNRPPAAEPRRDGTRSRPAERAVPQGRERRMERRGAVPERPRSEGRIERQKRSRERPERVERGDRARDPGGRVEREDGREDGREDAGGRIERQERPVDRPGRGDRYERGPSQRRNRLETPGSIDSGRPAVPPSRVVPGRQGVSPASARERRAPARVENRVIDRPRDYGEVRGGGASAPARVPRSFDGGGGRGESQGRAPGTAPPAAAMPSASAPAFQPGGGRSFVPRPFAQQGEAVPGGAGGRAGDRGGFRAEGAGSRTGEGFRDFDGGSRGGSWGGVSAPRAR